MNDHADYCPVHGITMWYWPTDGIWACQRSTCEATTPVRWEETQRFRRLREDMLIGMRVGWTVMPPYSNLFATGIH